MTNSMKSSSSSSTLRGLLLSLGVLGALTLPGLSQAQAASWRLEAPAVLQQGQTVSLSLQLDQPFAQREAGDALLFYGFKLDFDPSQLRFKSFAVSGDWSDDSAFLGAGEFGASNFPGVANTGQSTLSLGQLQFELLAPGASTLRLYSAAGNFNLGLGYALGETQAIDFSSTLQVSAVPEPAQAWLILAGLLALALPLRRRPG